MFLLVGVLLFVSVLFDHCYYCCLLSLLLLLVVLVVIVVCYWCSVCVLHCLLLLLLFFVVFLLVLLTAALFVIRWLVHVTFVFVVVCLLSAHRRVIRVKQKQ